MNVTRNVLNGQSWAEFCDALKAAGQDVLDNSAEDELERAEGIRYLARLTTHSLRQCIDPPKLTPPVIDYETPRIGGDNPDFRYGLCAVDGRAQYRIRGRLNDAYRFNIGAYHGELGTAQGLQCSGFLELPDLEVGTDGRFEIIASRHQQPGNWLALREDSNQLIIRQTLLQPATDRAMELTAEVMEGEAKRGVSPLSAEALHSRLQRSAAMMRGILQQFLSWTNDFKERPNQVHPLKPELMKLAQGDPNTQYYFGYFDLAEDEALLIRVFPPPSDYWGIHLANHWLESLDDRGRQLSVNTATAVPEDDGSVAVAVSRRDPGRPNWLDTQGHLRGTIALRLIGAEPAREPVAERIKLDDKGAR